jgi:hypothetical protein
MSRGLFTATDYRARARLRARVVPVRPALARERDPARFPPAAPFSFAAFRAAMALSASASLSKPM